MSEEGDVERKASLLPCLCLISEYMMLCNMFGWGRRLSTGMEGEVNKVTTRVSRAAAIL